MSMKKIILAAVLIPAILLSVIPMSQAEAHGNANLGMGARGEDVINLQSTLETKGYFPQGTVKGYFGPITKDAVVKFQGENGLPTTGFYGPLTYAKLHADNGATVSNNGAMSGSTTSTVPNPNTKAADLRVLLNALEHEHVDLASAAVRAGFDGHKSFEAVAGQLDKNSVDVSKAVGSIYGTEAEAKFLAIWRSHIGFFVDYTVAAKAGDKAGMDKAVANLGGYVDAISDFFSGANPNLPREAVHQLVSAHVGHLKAAVDTYGAGDFAGSYDNQHKAFVQIGSIADALSGAIVKQNPSKF